MADARKLKEKAQAHLAAYEYDRALALYEQIATEDARDLHAWTKIAELRRGMGQAAEAVTAYKHLVEAYVEDGLLLRAFAVCKTILSIEPSHTETQARLAELTALRKSAAFPQLSESPKQPSLLPPKQSTSIRDLIRDIESPVELEERDDDGLPSIPLFASLPKEAIVQMLEQMRMVELEEGEVAVREGEGGASFFIVSEGRMRVEKTVGDEEPVTLAFLGEGACFGEMSLIDGRPRSATVVADRDSRVFEVDRGLLDDLVRRHPGVAKTLRDFYTQRLLATAMALHPFFTPFSPNERRQLASRFVQRSFAPADVLIRAGERGEGFYILLSGRLAVQVGPEDQPQTVAELEPGEIFGEMSLLSKRPTTADVVALAESIVLRLGRDEFESETAARPEIREMLRAIYRQRLGENESLMASFIR